MSTELTHAKPGELAQAQPQTMLEIVMRAASDPTIDPARLREFLAIGRELEADKAKREYVAAFLAAKADLDGMKITKRGQIVYEAKLGKKGSSIGFMRYDDIAEAVKPILRSHGLAATYSYEMLAGAPKVVCVMKLMHQGGHSEEFRSVPLPMIDQSGGKTDIQGAGSVSSYGRRYVVCPAFDIVAEGEDNDGARTLPTEPITFEQAVKIEEILLAYEERVPGQKSKFMAWMKAELQVEAIKDLYQGAQLDAVMEKLRPRR
jgi:hypothetical protein